MGKFGREPFRCRGCHNRFYVYIRRDEDEVEESIEGTVETPEAEATPSSDEETHDSDVARPAEP
jgi:hypothetical protein